MTIQRHLPPPLKEVPSFQLAWFWRNFKITKTYIYRIELLVLSINIENKTLLLLKYFTTEVNKAPFTRNNEKNQRNHINHRTYGRILRDPSRKPAFFFFCIYFILPQLSIFSFIQNSNGSLLLRSKYSTHLTRKYRFSM